METQFVLYEAEAELLSVAVDDFQASDITIPVVWLLARKVSNCHNIAVCRPIAGSDCKIGDCTVAVARQWPKTTTEEWCFMCGLPSNNWNSSRGMAFSVQPVLRCYRQDS
jgi:hypothetical protein